MQQFDNWRVMRTDESRNVGWSKGPRLRIIQKCSMRGTTQDIQLHRKKKKKIGFIMIYT